jgi:hypothetical protein
MGITISRQINQLINHLLIEAAKQASSSPECFGVQGIIRIRKIPFTSLEEYNYWWLPELDASGRITRQPRMSQREKDRYTDAEFHNILTNNGRQTLLTYVGSQSGNSVPFAQEFGIGTGPLVAIAPADTALANEIYRFFPSAAIIVGTQVDIPSVISGSQANGTWTNAGLFGGGQAKPFPNLNTGTLYTHSLTNYVANFGGGQGGATIDYLLNIY